MADLRRSARLKTLVTSAAPAAKGVAILNAVQRRPKSPSRAGSPPAEQHERAVPSFTSNGHSIHHIWQVLASHDFEPRGPTKHAGSKALRDAIICTRRATASGALLFWLYCLSSFTYSMVGAAMLLHFNHRLPRGYHTSSPLPVDAYAALLVAQGPVSFAADAWARCFQHYPRHGLYLVDRMLATSMTVLTFHLGLVCWWPIMTDEGRRIAWQIVLGLVPFVLSQHALRGLRIERFMLMHIGWHVSIPAVAVAWLIQATAHTK